MAIAISGFPFSHFASTLLAANDYNPTESCVPAGAGPDVVFSYTANVDTWLDMTLYPAFRAALYVVSDCGDIEGSCVTGRSVSSGSISLHSILFPAGVTYYIICDGYTGVGTFTLTGLIDCVSGAEQCTWGDVKTLFR